MSVLMQTPPPAGWIANGFDHPTAGYSVDWDGGGKMQISNSPAFPL
jgi:hypothetical protein